MKFSLSELYCIVDAIADKKKEWLSIVAKSEHDPLHCEVTKEYDRIIKEANKEIKDQEGYSNALFALYAMPRETGGE